MVDPERRLNREKPGVRRPADRMCAPCISRYRSQGRDFRRSLRRGPSRQEHCAQPDDSAVLHKVKARVSLWLLIVVVIGLLLGMAIMGSGRAIGLVFVIFPLTCGIARWFDDGIWKLVPILAAAIVPIQSLPSLFTMMDYTTPASALFSYFQGVWMPASLLAVICLVGALTASLLRYAVKGKGKKQ